MAPSWLSSSVLLESSASAWDAATGGLPSPWTLFVTYAERAVSAGLPYAERLTATKAFAPLDAAIAPLMDLAGAEVARFVVAMFLTVALGSLYGRLRAPAAIKHLLGAAVGVALAQWVFGPAWVAALVLAVGNYVVMAVFSTVPGLSGLLPTASFVWCLGFLTASHLYRLHVDYLGWSLDVTGVLMLLTQKMTSLAYNLYDGLPRQKKAYDAELAKAAAKEAAERAAGAAPARKSGVVRTFEDRQRFAVSSLPDPLAFLGYVFFFPTLLAGPSVEYRVYLDAVEGAQPRPTWRVYLRALLGGVACLGLTQVTQSIWKGGDLLQPGVTSLLPPGLRSASGGPTVALVQWCWMFGLSKRFKYYFAWLVAEAASLGSGLGYSAEHKDWRYARNMDVAGFETASTLAEGTKAWNMGTQAWLERCAYKRLPRAYQLTGTYMLSAFWHGFYPGYYFTFGSAALLQSAEKALSAKVAPRLPKAVTAVASRVLSSLMLNYAVLPFQALGWDASVDVWGAFHWAGHVGAVAALLLCAVIPAPHKAKAVKTA